MQVLYCGYFRGVWLIGSGVMGGCNPVFVVKVGLIGS